MHQRYAQLARTLTRLSVDAPPVMASRIARFSAPGAWGSTGDWSEAQRMVWEKQAAAIESGARLWRDAALAYQRFWFDLMLGRWHAWPTTATMAASTQAALRPYQKRASANARRLRKR